MKRIQPTKVNKDPNKDSSSLSKSVSGSRKRKWEQMKSKEKRTKGNEKDSYSSDFDDMYDQIKTRRAKAKTAAESESGSKLNGNVDSSGYSLRSKNPPVSMVDDDAEDDSTTNTNQSQKRLQQPPVFINFNLMKIKMERDYIPVVVIKQEPPADDAKDDTDESAGAELNQSQHLVNSIPIPTSGQMTQNSQISQQQQEEQEKENVETDVNDSIGEVENGAKKEKKREKESDKIAKLEERNRKYKRDRQKEMDQLNLAIREQQSKIQHLKSTIDLQKVNHKVQLQGAQQQNRKGELKSIAQNEQWAENPNSKAEQSPNPKPVQINDFPTKVLSLIFDYLDLKSVKESRLVCRLWRNEAGKNLLQNFYLVCDEKEKCEITLKNWLKSSNSKSESNLASKSVALKLWSRGKNAQGTLQLLTKFPKLSCSVRELKFFNEQSDTQSLYEILLLLPNLQVLETKALDLNPGQKWLLPETVNSLCNGNEIPVKLELLIKKLQTLNELKLNYRMRKDAARHFFNHAQGFSSIRSVEIHAAGMSFISEFLAHFNSNLTITRFTLDVHKNYDVGLIRSFIIRISPSLKHLKLIVAKDAFRSSAAVNLNLSLNVEPWKDDWVIPIGLPLIQTVEIVLRPQEISSSLQKFMLKSIIIFLTLPQIKKLAVGFIPVKLQETVHKWNSHESAGGRTLASESLEELEIFPHFPKLTKSTSSLKRSYHCQCHRKKIPGHPWPALKSLKCSWDSQESFDPSFLSELKNLERLELNTWKWNPDENTMKIVSTSRYQRISCLAQEFEK